MAAMRKASLHPAAMALLLAAMAQVHNGRKRSRLEQELDGLLAAGSDWELTMLGWIEFGPMNRELAAQMKSLYQRSSLVREGLAKFFDQLLGVGERRRKIKVLIRALGAELAGLDDDPPEGARLADTVRDLKRLLMFLGCEEHCARIAASMRSAPVDADAVLRILIRMIDQFWLYPEWIENEARALSLDEDDVFRLARRFLGLTKLLAEPCFRDQDQRKQVVEALEGFITTRADEESQK
jgi:type III secretion system TyeA family effector delivery regulator